MGRPSIQVETLHGYTIEELVHLKNTTESKYTRLALTSNHNEILWPPQ